MTLAVCFIFILQRRLEIRFLCLYVIRLVDGAYHLIAFKTDVSNHYYSSL
jgi:hypothetical protein